MTMKSLSNCRSNLFMSGFTGKSPSSANRASGTVSVAVGVNPSPTCLGPYGRANPGFLGGLVFRVPFLVR